MFASPVDGANLPDDRRILAVTAPFLLLAQHCLMIPDVRCVLQWTDMRGV